VTAPDFDARAAEYDSLRPKGPAWRDRFDAIARLGGLRGKRVLDVGCGTGAVAAALVEEAGAKVWGVDQSVEMLAVAKSRVPPGVGLKQGRAEELPFRSAWFDAVVYSLVVHLLDRPSAFAEAARVLAPGGSVVIATFAKEHFDRYWAGAFFPSLAAVDHARFPTEAELEDVLFEAGFRDLCAERISSRETIGRETALERLRGRHISTFDLLDPDEVSTGIERAEAELPATVVVELEEIVVAAVSGSG
jgi:ubiquinone/menaquinone biosynthesis C-methylase UbiE